MINVDRSTSEQLEVLPGKCQHLGKQNGDGYGVEMRVMISVCVSASLESTSRFTIGNMKY
jgi:hypothetical protein